MNRIDVHNHFIPSLDDGCRDVAESLECLRMMHAAGYTRVFCTPHAGAAEFTDLTTPEIAQRTTELQRHVSAANIPIELRPGGELRLSPHIAEDLTRESVPTFGHNGRYVLADLWEEGWPAWASRAVEWLQKKGFTVIIAHPERMPVIRANPDKINELAALGVLFQGNLGPIAGADSTDIVALAQRFLKDGRYFMVGTDGHRTNHLAQRLSGLQKIEELVGSAALRELTETNPARLWT